MDIVEVTQDYAQEDTLRDLSYMFPNYLLSSKWRFSNPEWRDLVSYDQL